MERNIFSCVTCDVEIGSEKDVKDLESILYLVDKYDIRCTFFIETRNNFELLSDIRSAFRGHEVGLHIHWGDMLSYTKSLKNVPLDIMRFELETGLRSLQNAGFDPISFRGGGLCCSNAALKLLKEHNFKIDSSVAARLNETKGWFQGHTNVPYMSWYHPSKISYDIVASSPKERVGIVEIPVTRLMPSGRTWFPYTLTPTNPLYGIIIRELTIKSLWESPTLITPIFHSWGEGKFREERFPLFLNRLDDFIKFIIRKDVECTTLGKFLDTIQNHE